MKQILVGIITILLMLCIYGCGCKHEWTEATCQAPKTCDLCGEQEGDVSEHAWSEATCLWPKTCDTCGETEGEPLGHDWTGILPRLCNRCKVTEWVTE